MGTDKWMDVTKELRFSLNKSPSGDYAFYGFLGKDVVVILDHSGIRKLCYPYSEKIKLMTSPNGRFKILKEVL